jgi:epoxide hydrolase 4
MKQGRAVANGVRYAWIEEGSGPLVLLLHGYPDNAHSWDHQLRALAAAGYRAVAPFMRGYPPTEVPAGGFYDRATLASDVVALIEQLGGGEPCDLVGQDWGAAIAYGVLGAFGERIRRAVILAVPHPAVIRRTLKRSPAQVIRSFHWFLFQLPWLPERLVRARNAAFLELLWRLWSPAYSDRAHVAAIRRTMAAPEVAAASLSYYRAAMQTAYRDPALAEVYARLDDPIEVPTRVLCGSKDMRGRMLEEQRELFRGEYDWHLVEGAGHFLHREQPDEVSRLIIEWLAVSGGRSG